MDDNEVGRAIHDAIAAERERIRAEIGREMSKRVRESIDADTVTDAAYQDGVCRGLMIGESIVYGRWLV